MFDVKELYIAKSVDDALRLLDENENSMIISGGTDVLIKLREGKFSDAVLVSVNGLDELRYVKIDEQGAIRIGSTSCFTYVEEHPIINEHIPVLGYAAGQVGGPQIRNAGTIGGNVCNAATSADTATALFAMNAKLRLRSANGERILSIHEFYTGPGKTVRNRNELLIELIIDKEDYEGFCGKYIKYAMREALDIATLATTGYVKLSEDKKTIEEARLAFGVAAPTPIRARKCEEFLKGKPATAETLEALKSMILDEVNPRTSWRASKEFRQQIIKENSKRALAASIKLCGGELDA